MSKWIRISMALGLLGLWVLPACYVAPPPPPGKTVIYQPVPGTTVIKPGRVPGQRCPRGWHWSFRLNRCVHN